MKTETIKINTTMSTDDFYVIKGAIADQLGNEFAGMLSTENIQVKNNIFTWASGAKDGNMEESIEINIDALLKIIGIIGYVYKTIKPMASMIKNIFGNLGDQLENISGKTEKIVNGVAVIKPVTVGRRTTLIRGENVVNVDMKATAPSEEEAKELLDKEFESIH